MSSENRRFRKRFQLERDRKESERRHEKRWKNPNPNPSVLERGVLVLENGRSGSQGEGERC
ncbi:putative cAMP-dependent protein kinase catalytic subunit isoform [Sesbania bispinosa]|nr:putative cAMP-dependent protein kinase catalytic subunit isoform [Sesbania bispinosa]